MYIKSLVIDGFKSYAQRTEVNGFDPLFNAITGLNGSGKSNILDSICFLLGITNLQQVRATNLQDLVYKCGQGGVTKATVSITFDNSDKKQSPLGYEQYDEITVTRQVVIGGKNKYLINGSNATNTRVQDMFRSVQLNINNPHFLIMQGRITKVLNMKPPEILSMIEEAAGTKLYESKKESAQKTIEKKDAKLREIETILREEITPTLTKLKEERSSYLEYQKIVRELEHLQKLYVAYQFMCAEDMKKNTAKDLIEMKEQEKKYKATLEQNNTKIAEFIEVMKDIQKKRDEEAGGAMATLEKMLKECQMTDMKAETNLKHKKESLKAEQKKHKELTRSRDEDKSVLTSKQKEIEKFSTNFEKLQKEHENDKAAVTEAQEHFHAVSAGLSNNEDGKAASLKDQLIMSKKEISTAETEKKQAKMRLTHAETEIKKKQQEMKKSEQGYKKDQQAFEAVQKQVDKLKAELENLNYEEGKEETLVAQKRTLSQEIGKLRDRVETLGARNANLQFDYRDPEKNFDRSKVKGLVAKLIQVKDPKTVTALEVAAGGKLYNVIVDSEVTGKKLLQNGQLRRRVTIIPLNKINCRPIDNATVRTAENLVGKGNAQTALSLVGYDKDIERAMQYVFGGSFVCADMDKARKVTFDPKIMKRTVTLDGDSFDPSGTLTGGSRSQNQAILARLTDLNEAESKLQQKQAELNHVEKELSSINRTAERFQQLNQQYGLKSHEANLLKERLESSSHHVGLEGINQLQTTIDEQKRVLKESEDTVAKAKKKVADLEDKINNEKEHRERELKQAEQDVQTSKKRAVESEKKLKQKQQDMETLRLEAEELTKEITSLEEQLVTIEESIKDIDSQCSQLDEERQNTKAAVKDAQTEVNKQKDLLRERDKEIQQTYDQQQKLAKECQQLDCKLTELEHKKQKFHKDSADAANKVDYLLNEYPWIADERKYFGQADTAYDFKANNPREAGQRIKKLQETKDKLAKNVNMRAMNMLGKAEEQYAELIKKRTIVLNDKAKIAKVISELDKKKNEALRKAHEQVNKDFGSIFSSLLPGTQARLVAPEGQTVLEGLTVKVAFGDVWKESLTELSGGQRSLVALSLILSLLLFKPAPLYILDEVDAALDLSHTQNIGQMLRTHFKHSQFIVVSLKDGMFNNANVLFKTKFVDGVSTVTRYVQNPYSRDTSSKDGKKTSKRARIEEVTG
ncbi:structural maintenance of chromosomes protein 2-like [Tubulanus polymorphus]|uniref:structural maintenance of chromosomes protein 2-like n=1 Tax=Tubulanus polymorphus TaxID=672921 RepID=UPI003DA5513C